MADKPKIYWTLALAPIVLIGVMLFVVPSYRPEWRHYVFVVVLAMLVAELAVLGWLINDRPAGVFIDDRYRISLSKLQAGAWTVVVLSAFATAAALNAVQPDAGNATIDALDIKIPGELLLAMGISATSLVATPGLLSLKAAEQPSEDSKQRADARLPGDETVDHRGKLALNKSVTDASWADIVTGEEVGNFKVADLGKIQQVIITFVLLGVYAGYLYQHIRSEPGPIHELPKLNESFVWLMGISHASYLAYKAAPHTSTATPPAAPAGRGKTS